MCRGIIAELSVLFNFCKAYSCFLTRLIDIRNIGIRVFCSSRVSSILFKNRIETMSTGPIWPSSKEMFKLKIWSRFYKFISLAWLLLYTRIFLTFVSFSSVSVSYADSYGVLNTVFSLMGLTTIFEKFCYICAVSLLYFYTPGS